MNILLADDHSIVRTGLRFIVQALDSQVTVLEASDYGQVERLVQMRDTLDLVVFDFAMPGVQNLATIGVLCKMIPKTPVVIFSAAEDVDTIYRTVDEGARGFIPKSLSRSALLDALRLVLAGNIYLPASLIRAKRTLEAVRRVNFRNRADRVMTRSEPKLTRRQREILVLICEGKSNGQIAQCLELTLATVKTHVANIFEVLRVHNRTEAGYMARRLGLVRMENRPSS